MLNINEITSNLAQEMNKKVDDIILAKLMDIKRVAARDEEYVLYSLMESIMSKTKASSTQEIAEVKQLLEESGYTIQMNYPEWEIVDMDGGVGAIFNPEEIKLSITKKLYEV